MKKIFLFILLTISISGFSQSLYNRWVPASGTDTYSTNITGLTSYNNNIVYVKFANTNTTDATLTINGALGAKHIRAWDGDSWELLTGGELDPSTIYKITYYNTGDYFQLEGTGSGGGGGGGGSEWATGGTITMTNDVLVDGGAAKKIQFGTASAGSDNPTDFEAYSDAGYFKLNSTGFEIYNEPGGIASIVGESGGILMNVAGGGHTGAIYFDESGGHFFNKLDGNTTTTKKFLTETGTGTDGASPVWSDIAAGDVPTLNQNTTGSAATLTTARTIGTATGDVTSAGSSFNGSANNTNAYTLATVNSNVGSFGSATQVPVLTVNGKGLITAVSNTTITPAIPLAGSASLTGALTLTGTSTNTIKFNFAGLGTAVTSVTNGAGLFLDNPDAATVGNNQTSPWITFGSRAWDVTGGASYPVRFAIGSAGTQGTSTAYPVLTFMSSVNSGAYSTIFSINALSGNVTTTGTYVGAGFQTVNNSTAFQIIGGRDVTNSITIKPQNVYDGSTKNNTLVNLFAGGSGFLYTGGTNTGTSFKIAPIINVSAGTTLIREFVIEPTETSLTGVTHQTMVINSATGQNIIGGSTSTASTRFEILGLGTTSSTINTRWSNSSNTLLSQLTDDGNWSIAGNVTLNTVGNKLSIKEGSGGFMGQTTLVAGTKAVTVTGVTTSTRCFAALVIPNTTTLTTSYQCACTANTVTLQANVAAGTINTADVSTLNYILFEPAP